MKQHVPIYDFMWSMREASSQSKMLVTVYPALQSKLMTEISWQIEHEIWFKRGYVLFEDLADSDFDLVVSQVRLGPKMMGG